MILYFSGTTFQHVIEEVIEQTKQSMIFPTEVSNEIDFLKTIRQNIAKYDGVDILIVDDSACQNTEEEMLMALEMLRSMYDQMKIIVFTPYRQEGDDFLTKCFNMGIMNLINTDDFLKIRQELEHCIVDGMTYREAARFKECKKEKVIVKHEMKRSVNKRMIGICGTESNIGVTHNAIVLANFFRKKGFMVALVEMNLTGAFDRICEDYGEKKFQDGYFTLNGIDFYSNLTADNLTSVMEHSYNVVLLDMGLYQDCDRTMFERCDDRLLICGIKPWELIAMDKVFDIASKDAIMQYVFCFNFVQESDFENIRLGMGEIENVHFLNYTVDPFSSADFADGDKIFAEILPEKEEEKKKGLMKRILKK